MVTINNLRSYALFGGVNDGQIARLLPLLKPERFVEGAFLFRQGEPADRLFFIQRGQVEVLNQLSDDTLVRLAVRQEGDSVGEMAMIDMQRRSASVRALEPVQALSLSYDNLSQLYAVDHQLYTLILMNLARELSRRLRSMDAELATALFTSQR